MTSFPLKIVTPEGLFYDGQARELIVPTAGGYMGILAGHINCVASLGRGRVTVHMDGQKRCAVCNGGMVSVIGGKAILAAASFRWDEEIDAAKKP